MIAYQLLKHNTPYQEPGGDYFDRIHADGLKRYYIKRLEQLGVSIFATSATDQA